MRIFIHKLSVLLLISVAILSCDSVHEFPGENPVDPTLIHVDLELTIQANDLSDNNTFPIEISNDQTLRAVFEIYRDNEEKPVQRKEVEINSTSLNSVIKETFSLNASQYRMVAWIDYTAQNSSADQHYSTSKNLRNIKTAEPLVGNADAKDCFFANTDIDLSPYAGQWYTTVSVQMQAKRPVAKYMLIANDVHKYILATGESISSESINKYSAKIFYEGFAPNGFDAYNNQLNDAQTGLFYSVNLQLINNNEALICYDYPLAYESDSQFIVGLQIFDEKGELVNEIGNIRIPVVRDVLTVIRSAFLTREHAPGITVDPDYEGTIEVTVP